MRPLVIENSAIPKILSWFAPIQINAIALWPFVFVRGEISERTLRHETIHFEQQLETLVLGFYAIYIYDYMVNRLKGMSGPEAYLKTRAEKEAHAYDTSTSYLQTRKRFKWLQE